MRILAMDIGGTFLKYALYDGETVLVSQKTPSRASEGADALVQVLFGVGETFRGQFDGVAVATAGTVGPEGELPPPRWPAGLGSQARGYSKRPGRATNAPPAFWTNGWTR